MTLHIAVTYRRYTLPGFLEQEQEGYVQLVARSMASQYERQVKPP